MGGVEEKEQVKNDSNMLVLSNCKVGVSLTEKRQTAGEADLGARIRSLDSIPEVLSSQ